ncbi:SRPBCC domain-containing protein [Streptomyces aurantiacus]|uniref:SRPBCC domain-containing protein n=1 Tax=Streptomyces aurantiacus TaxID=47760 RepID=UPI0006E1C68F|nr:SRPBCC domain-containing protein [Streptomyces aurantiacus]
MISITEEIVVPSPPERVWEVISDPSAVVSCVGGAELGPSHDDGSFDGTLAIKFGGLRVKFAARLSLDLDESAREGRLGARGADGQGATRFSADATFRVVEGDSPGISRVFCDGEIELNGKLVKLIESGAGMVVSRMTEEFTGRLIQKCAAPTEPLTAASTEPFAAAPSAPLTSVRSEPRGAVSDGARTAPSRPAGLFARLRAWWAGRRAGRAAQPPPAQPQPQPPQATPRSENRSGEALDQGGRR